MVRILVSLILVTLIACSPFSQSSDYAATIDEVKQSPYDQLLQVMGDKAFVYDLSINDKTAEEIHLFVDYYEVGEFVETMVEFSIAIEDEKKLTLAYIQQVYQDTYEKWIGAIIDNRGFASGTFENENPADRFEELGAVLGSVSMPLEIKKDKKSVVASISYSGKDVISSPVAIETEEQLEQLVDDDYVYVLSVQLK